jgi:competence protein ComEC
MAIAQHRYRNVVLNGPAALTIDGVALELLHPTPTFQPHMKPRGRGENAGENNGSLVVKLTYGSISILFTGDIEQEAERFLLQSGRNLRATILKVPHHGSRTSSSAPFVRAIEPKVAVFSVQRDSRFGHPHPLVVDRYTALGTQILRTDVHGAITLRTDGRSVWIDPYRGESTMFSVPLTPSMAERHAPLSNALR